MLKGHVFKNEIFGNQIFALFIDTFLNGECGISSNYGNGMNITYSGSSITIEAGSACIKGRFVEEDIGSTIATGTDTAYCKLVIEINLSKEVVDSSTKQYEYKIVKSTTGYPNLTQNNIVKDNSGIYQYELARFRTSINGITDFQDKRTFLDFESIFATIRREYERILQELQQELLNIEDGSAYVLKTFADATYLNKNNIKVGTEIPAKLQDGEYYFQIFD